ncbi:MAG: protein-ADP-ribose hydrolase [Oscillospiraceae bacterium]|nr:protein-ADP-ribose hydrolase [Oscillospiraceae bacterium]
MKQNERLLYLIKNLLSEDRKYEKIPIPESEEERFKLLRSLMNIRPPKPVSEKFLAVQDEFLKEKIYSKGITDITDLVPVENGIYLWKGDITTLKCGAIVNAANSQMLGCFQPCHSCIDNVIHTFAGIQLRLECADIMDRQGIEEPTGTAKITSAYNLPCDHIIHTVGPIVNGKLTEKHCRQLESCYRSCLEAAMQNNVTSIAFCCISTGVFGFPQKEAAEIAVKTVRKFRKNHNIEVIFNVFTENDYTIYSGLLG